MDRRTKGKKASRDGWRIYALHIFTLRTSLYSSELSKVWERRWRITTEVTFLTPTKISTPATSVVRPGAFRYCDKQIFMLIGFKHWQGLGNYLERDKALFSFQMGRGHVIPGVEKGVLGACVGEKRRIIIPPHLAYGASGDGGVIPPNSTIAFDLDIFEIFIKGA